MLKFGSNDDSSNEDSFKPGKWFTGLFNKDEPLLENTDDAEEENGKKAGENSTSGGQGDTDGSSWLTGFKGIFKKDDAAGSPETNAHEELYKLDDENSSGGTSWFSNLTDRFTIKPKDSNKEDETAKLIKVNDSDNGSQSSVNDEKSEPKETTQEGNTAVSWLKNMRGGGSGVENQSQGSTKTNSAGLDPSLYKTNIQSDEDKEDEKKDSNGWFSSIKGLVVKDARKETEIQEEKPEQSGLNKYISNLKLQVRAIRSIIEDFLD